MFTRIRTLAIVIVGCVLAACALTPAQNAAVSVLVDAAVGVAVQHDTKDPAVMAKRAAQVVSIAGQLKALDGGVIATLPLVTAALQPLLVKANLGPADLLAANVLVAALSQVINAQVNPSSGQTAAIQTILQDVITAASLYLPSTP